MNKRAAAREDSPLIENRGVVVTADPFLQARSIVKRYPGVVALDGVGLDVRRGEVLALLGENGAGKSTLVKILSGVVVPDSGKLIIEGNTIQLDSARKAEAAGISVIHQESIAFEQLAVGENILFGDLERFSRLPLINWRATRRKAQSLLDALELNIDASMAMWKLSVAQRHMVAAAKAMNSGARLVIMDEPTASLSATEIAHLYEVIRKLKENGTAIIFISHKLNEVFDVSDRYVVLRDGQVAGAGNVVDVGEKELVQLLVGRELENLYPRPAATPGDVVLGVEGLSRGGEFEDVRFHLKHQEIVAFYGLIGSGRTELVRCLFGASTPSTGRIELDGQYVRFAHPAEAMRARLALVPEDRQKNGIVGPMSIVENLTLTNLERVSGGVIINEEREILYADEISREVALKAAHLDQSVAVLSGGNQQKVAIGKWLRRKPSIMILDEPTKGIDVAAKAAVHRAMAKLVEGGMSLLIVTSELEEARGLADRIYVMRKGRICSEFKRGDGFDPAAIVSAALGEG